MSEAQETMEFEETSSEDKFFGVKTTIGSNDSQSDGGQDSDFEIELVDDRPEEDRRPPKNETVSEDISEEELSSYSEKVQKRINKLRYDQHEERRRREEAEKMREEAVRYAQQVTEKNKEYESLINRGETALIGQIKDKAKLSYDTAKEMYRKAYEEGDTDNVVAAQEKLIKAQTELSEAEKYENNLARTAQQQPQAQQPAQDQFQQQPQQPQQQVTVHPEAQKWSEKNPWFMQEGYEEMTSLAYGAHSRLMKQGVAPNSPEYFAAVDTALRQRFPEFDWQDESDTYGRNAPVTVSQPSSVVAPQTRNNGAKPRKVRLAPSQIALAKRLGLTNEQYAKQLLKESN